ncbi:lipid A deacylase LpxR family protein [Photobacterium sanguinicancri]|uniref:lipid A deacylase LpxR family protein n=1 Tax=Photobacterium sanguinicancri TaxID=875932 RepID=UPI0009FAB9DD|nr:lipid A deacylase LpxR family protein [Photobacterium sanguinicancri]
MRIKNRVLNGFKCLTLATTVFTSPITLGVEAVSAPKTNTYSSISFSIENDGIVQTDQNYTNGIFLNYSSAVTRQLSGDAPLPISTIASWLPLDSNAWQGWRLNLGQQMWTPSDITYEEPQPNERPYAGLLFFDIGVFQYTESKADKLTFRFGTVGPNSLAENAQKLVHYLTPSTEPQGWEYQIENQIIANLNYEGHRLLSRNPSINDKAWEWSVIGRIDAGNYRSEAAIGSILRWGNQLSESFGSAGFTPNQITDISLLSASRSGYFLYTGIEGRYRFNDITIEGDKPAEVYDVSLQPWQATAVAGAVLYRSNWGFSLSMAAKTKNYKEDTLDVNAYGAFKVFYRY